MDNYVAPYADTDELRELVNDLMHSPIRVPVMFAAFYGMRRSEALGIRKAVIDRKKKTITVCHTVIEVSVQAVSYTHLDVYKRQALEVAHRGYVLSVGHIAMQGNARDLMEDPTVQTTYLGIK